MTTTRPRRIVRRAAMVFAVVVLVVGFAVYGHIRRHSISVLEDSSALWETHDLIQMHVSVHGATPRSWDDLVPYFDEIDAGYGNSRLEYLQDRIVLGTDRNSLPLSVRSGNLEGEQRRANQQVMAAIQTRERAVE